MLRFSFYCYVFSLLLALPMQISLAAFPIDEEVSFTGGGTNLTFSSDWVGEFRMAIDASNSVTGYLDADGLPGGQTICGMGDFTGSKNGSIIEVNFTSLDTDAGCGFDHGNVNTFTGEFSENETVFSGEYSISNGQRGVFSFSTEESKEEWGSLTELNENYLMLQACDSNEIAFAHQFACIANASCAATEVGREDWGDGFVRHLFQSMQTPNGLTASLNIDCPSFITDMDCFLYKGAVHAEELRTGFYSYCDQQTNPIDFEKWDDDHNLFLERGVNQCFVDVLSAGELPNDPGSAFILAIINESAVFLRERAQSSCISRSTPEARSNYRLALSDLSKDDLFSQEMADSGTINVEAKSGDFFISVGDVVELKVTMSSDNGEIVDITNSVDNVIDVIKGGDSVELEPGGLMNVNSYVIPSSEVTLANMIYVTVRNGESYGIGQFAVIDVDSDGDDLVDSFDPRPTSARDPERDSDSDTLTDYLEAFIGTDPRARDSDGDGYSDGFEYRLNSEPLDARCNPIEGCEEIQNPIPISQPEDTPDTPPSEDSTAPTDSSEATPTEGSVTDEQMKSGSGGIEFGFLMILALRCCSVFAGGVSGQRRGFQKKQ